MLPASPDSSTPAIETEVAYRLRQLRQARGYTQQEVYDVTGIHIARLEARRTNMTVGTLAALCRFYDVALAEFFQGL